MSFTVCICITSRVVLIIKTYLKNKENRLKCFLKLLKYKLCLERENFDGVKPKDTVGIAVS